MARGAVITAENNFTQGLITEASAMNFPENAITEGENVVFSELGMVSRRKGFNYEINKTDIPLSSLSPLQGVFNEFKWDSVGGRGDISFIVQQIGSRIRFFLEEDGSISSGLKPFFVDLTLFKTNTTDQVIADNDCQFTFGKGYLFIVHPFCDPISVTYDEDADTITATKIEIQVRDFERLDDGLQIDERPPTLTDIHKYNLYNQGWYFSAIVHGQGTPRNVLVAWDQYRSDFPSNADIWWVYKDGREIASFQENYDEGAIGPSQVTMGNTPAPNGHYVYSAWDINRTGLTNIPGLPSQTSGPARPSCIVFYAGRVFYAGVSSSGYSDKIYFSQIIESDDQFGRCYQINDPTSETIFDLLDTDGGVISLPLVSKVTSMQVLGDVLIIIGTNGVFAIRGSDNGPFRATDYTIEYVSEIGTASPSSVVNVDNSLLWWNYDALYALTKDQIGISFEVQNASKPTIQEIIDSVPPRNKSYIKSAYNKKDRIIQWLYSTSSDLDPTEYNMVLEFNVVSRAFYIHSLPQEINAPKIIGILSVSGARSRQIPETVLTNSLDIVETISGEDVEVRVNQLLPNTELFKYPTLTGNNFTYSNQVDEHVDWEEFDFHSYFISGYRIRGELLRQFQSSPIVITLGKIEDGEIIIRGIWDYGARTTTPQWLYVRGTDIGDYLVRRVKLRGKGRSFQLRFDSEGRSPFELYGWTTFDTGGQQP